MRSFVKQANGAGIKESCPAFEIVGRSSPRTLSDRRAGSRYSLLGKSQGRRAAQAAIFEELDGLPAGQLVMLKLTLRRRTTSTPNSSKHPKVVRVVRFRAAIHGKKEQALAEESRRRASFSRALVEGLSAQHARWRSTTPCWMHRFRASSRRQHLSAR